MNTLIILIVFGLVVPVVNIFANTLIGNNSEEVKEAKKQYFDMHPIASIIGTLFSCCIPLAYWIYVIIQAM